MGGGPTRAQSAAEQEQEDLLREQQAERRRQNTKIEKQRLAILKRSAGPPLDPTVSLLNLRDR